MTHLHEGNKHSLATSEDNTEGIRRLIITITIVSLVGVIFAGIVFVWMRIGCRAHDRLSAGIMALFSEAGVRPNAPTPLLICKGVNRGHYF